MAASAAKADATAAFKSGDYDTAASLFRRAIALGSEEPHLLHTNLAAAESAAGRHEDALAAADAALALVPSHTKAHYRKALALTSLERWVDARAACTTALGLGANEQLQALLKKCNEKLASAPPPPLAPIDPADRREKADAAAAALAEEVATRRAKAEAETRERAAAAAAAKAALEAELAAEGEARKAEAAKRRQQQKEESLKANEKTVANRAAVAERLAEAIGGNAMDIGDEPEPPSARSKGAAKAQQAKSKVDAWREAAMCRELVAPRVPNEFLKQYALLRKDTEGFYTYLRLMPSETLIDIFKPEVSDQVLVSIAKALSAHLPSEDVSWAIEWLQQLTKVQRFDMTVMMLDKPSKQAITDLFDSLAAKGGAPSLPKLRKAYLG